MAGDGRHVERLDAIEGHLQVLLRRQYVLRRRAVRQEETRRRIVEAAVELHTTIGPSQTSIAAIAKRAGVQRLTVYRHFPDKRSLSFACSSHYRALNPLPDPAVFRAVADPEERLRVALSAAYAYHHRTGAQLTAIFHNAAATDLLLDEVAAPDLQRWQELRDVLAAGWRLRDRRRQLHLAVIGHALQLDTWRSFVEEYKLEDAELIDLMVALVQAVVQPHGPRPAAHQ